MSKAAKLKAKLERRGRAPKPGMPRYADGSIVRAARSPAETENEILAIALAQPHRRPFQNKHSALAGYASGRLFLQGILTKPQFQALERFGLLSIRYSRLVTGRSVQYPCMSIERTDRGASDYEIDGADLDRLKCDHADMLWTIYDAGDGQATQRIMFRLSVLDREQYNLPELGALRCGLNALAKLWGLTDAGKSLNPDEET